MGTPPSPPFPTGSSPPFASPQVWVSFFAMYSFGSFAIRSAPDSQLPATRGHVLWRTLVPTQAPLLDHHVAQHSGWSTPPQISSSLVSKAATPKKRKPGPSGRDDSDTEDVVHWTCACQKGALARQLPRCARRAFANFVCCLFAATLTTTGIKAVLCATTAPITAQGLAPVTDVRPCLAPYLHALSDDNPRVLCPIFQPCPTTVSGLRLCHCAVSPRALLLHAFVVFVRAMGVTTLVAHRVHRFVPFVRNRNVGQKDVW